MRFASHIVPLALCAAFVLASPATAQFLINEVDCDTSGTDMLEFVEIYDGGFGGSSLVGYCLVFFNGNATGDASYRAIDLTGVTDVNGYYLVGNVGVVPAPAQTWPNDTLQNGPDAVAIYFAAAATFNCAPLTPGGPGISPPLAGLIDAVVYDTGDPDDLLLLAALTPGQPEIDEWQHGAALGIMESIMRCPDGAGGPLVTTSITAAAPTPGAANVCPALYTIAITQPLGCGGPIHFDVANAAPFSELYNLISFQCVAPGSGPFFGLTAGLGSGDPIGQLFYPVGTHPFHVNADGAGAYNVAFPVPPCVPVISFTVQCVSLQVAGYSVLAVSQPTTCVTVGW